MSNRGTTATCATPYWNPTTLTVTRLWRQTIDVNSTQILSCFWRHSGMWMMRSDNDEHYFYMMSYGCECSQGGESQVSLSDMTCSESASSFQSVSQTSTPEILVGLVYNATTGRLSVEVIKGIHFKNLAANKPPSKFPGALGCEERLWKHILASRKEIWLPISSPQIQETLCNVPDILTLVSSPTLHLW